MVSTSLYGINLTGVLWIPARLISNDIRAIRFGNIFLLMPTIQSPFVVWIGDMGFLWEALKAKHCKRYGVVLS